MGNRVLLVFDDFVESEKWMNLLQKMGFQAEGIRNEAGLMTQLLSLRPDAVFVMGQGLLLNPVRVLEKLKSQSWFNGKVILFESEQRPIHAAELAGMKFDGLLPADNFSDIERLEILSQTLELPFEDLLEKHQATIGIDLGDYSKSVTSTPQASSKTKATRSSKRSVDDYKKLKSATSHPGQISRTTLSRPAVEAVIKQSSRPLTEEQKTQIDLKRAFVRALFKRS